MGNIPLEHGLIVATILFALGFYGVMVRRNLLFILMSLEIMMNAAALAFVLAGSAWAQPDGSLCWTIIFIPYWPGVFWMPAVSPEPQQP